MNQRTYTEKDILKISVYGAVFFAVFGVILGLISRSQMVLFDGVYSFISVLLSLLSLYAAHFIKKEDNKRFPFGKDIIEPIVIIFKYLIILILCLSAFVNALNDILSGGRDTEIGYALVYATISTIGCILMYVFLGQKGKVLNSGFIHAEVNQWRMDALLSGAVLAGFILASVTAYTSYDYLLPYIDPAMVIIVAGYFIKVPAVEIFKAFREVLNMSPNQEIQNEVNSFISQITKKYQCEESILRIMKTGSRLCIEVDFVLNEKSKINTIQDQDLIREQISTTINYPEYKLWLSVSFTNNREWVL